MNNNGSGLDDWIYWHLPLQSLLIAITIAHNQWLPTTRSIPYWTTSVFPCVVTDLVLIYESVTSTNDLRFTRDEWWTKNDLRMNHVSPFYNFGANRIQITTSNSSCYCVLIRCCGNVPSEPMPSNGRVCGTSLTAHFWRSGLMSQYYLSLKGLGFNNFGSLSSSNCQNSWGAIYIFSMAMHGWHQNMTPIWIVPYAEMVTKWTHLNC
jgi:hypothetical protein